MENLVINKNFIKAKDWFEKLRDEFVLLIETFEEVKTERKL